MTRKQVLSSIVASILVGAALVMLGVLFTSLRAENNSKARASLREISQFDVSGLPVGGETLEEYMGDSVLILRISEDEFKVLRLLATFEGRNSFVCEVQWPIVRQEWEPEDTHFRAPCRGIRYGPDGDVLSASLPDALPLEALDWKFVGQFLRIIGV